MPPVSQSARHRLLRCGRSALLAVIVFAALSAPRARAEPPKRDSALWAQLQQVLPAEQFLEARFLEYLGWRLRRDPALRDVRITGGFPCRFPSLPAARRAGALQIHFPPSPSPQQLKRFGARAATLAAGLSSRCAYKFHINRAVRRAIGRLERLTKAKRYKFPDLLFGAVDSPWFQIVMPKPEWAHRGPLWVGSGSARAAMDAFFRRGAAAECYSGQALAIYSIQYELYGPEAFDKAFVGEDLTLGPPLMIKASPIGRYTSYTTRFPWRALLIPECEQKKDPVFPLAQQGPMAFVGLSGIVRNQSADTHSNENWILTSISKRALDDLVKGGGLRYISALTKQIWKAAEPGRGFLVSSAKKRGAEREVDRLLAQPVFTEFMIYVHPYGNVPLGDIVRKKLAQVKSPVEVVIYTHGREDALFQRYHNAFKRGWLRGARAQPALKRPAGG